MDAARHIADAVMPSVMIEGFAVVFHAPSGMTHLLAPPLPEILAEIAPDADGRGGGATAEEIVARLRATYELDGDVAAVVAARLAELHAAGLVRAA
ncbi:HPr-rel-A system PqqD family peptide chaperone [Sphingomonas montana]|uniref:HPr-rel-A system PqqD family peptide chaperone n=1 Tax=Sphingomonas montana TaxID=1843236 RepID=UPI00096C26FE|nr:HPr-rel-A system PqqD family peptide chaperone [Sphingomonas montana]